MRIVEDRILLTEVTADSLFARAFLQHHCQRRHVRVTDAHGNEEWYQWKSKQHWPAATATNCPNALRLRVQALNSKVEFRLDE